LYEGLYEALYNKVLSSGPLVGEAHPLEWVFLGVSVFFCVLGGAAVAADMKKSRAE
jgi:hypothetical protein